MTNQRPGLEIITGAESVKLMSELTEVRSIIGRWWLMLRICAGELHHTDEGVGGHGPHHSAQRGSLEGESHHYEEYDQDVSLQAVERTGFLTRLVSLLQTQDFLVQLNTTELLTQLAVTSHGHKYLETTGVMETMGVMLRDCPNLPFADVIMPGMKQF